MYNHKLSAIEIFFINGIKDFIVTYLFQIVINIVYFMFQPLSPNTSRDLNLTKNVRRLETTGAINVQIKASEEDTIVCYKSLLIPKSRC